MEYFGVNWQIGRSWGNHHPDHICWNSPESIIYGKDWLGLGIDYKPMDFIVPDYINPDAEDPEDVHKKRYPWSVGYLSSTDVFKYGYFRVDFKLPTGNHLWPAIWLSDCKTWPPEIDIVEGWTGSYNWPIFKPKSASRMYRINPFANRIFPGIHLGTNPKEQWGRSYTKFRGTYSCYLNIPGYNICELIWTPDRLIVYYNSHKVMDEADPEILKYYNNSEGMYIHLNNYVTNDFTPDDYNQMVKNRNKDFCKWFYIYNVQYSPDYKNYLIGIK